MNTQRTQRPILHVRPGFSRRDYERRRKLRWSSSAADTSHQFAKLDFAKKGQSRE